MPCETAPDTNSETRFGWWAFPHTAVRKVLTVLAEEHQLRFVDGQEVLARHGRSYMASNWFACGHGWSYARFLRFTN